ncbi:hypothetical protein [Pseudomonas prosekii]|uniref:hypothetical protein n=1 Tax=Pseudomonas prosekii TaxID=1148509 RepID=UPI003F75498D
MSSKAIVCIALKNVSNNQPVGAELAREGGMSGDGNVDWQGLFASKLCSCRDGENSDLLALPGGWAIRNAWYLFSVSRKKPPISHRRSAYEESWETVVHAAVARILRNHLEWLRQSSTATPRSTTATS